MRWVMGMILGAGTYAAVVLAVLTMPGDYPLPTYVWIPAFLVVFPAHLAAILSVKAARRGRRLSMPWPRHAVIALVTGYELVGMAVLVASVATTPGGIPDGQPEELGDGRYALNNHGQLTYITHPEYLHYQEIVQRGFLGIALILCLIGAAFVAGSLDFRTKSSEPTDQAQPRRSAPQP